MGAVRIRIGDLEVEFDGPGRPEAPPGPVPRTPAEIQAAMREEQDNVLFWSAGEP